MVLFLVGLFSGIVSGMGIGGGAILIPALVIFFKPEQHVAQGINLVFFIPTALTALAIHIRNRKVDFKTAVPIIISGIIGAFAGSRLAIALPGAILKRWFGIFLLALGVYEMLRRDKNRKGRKVV